MSYDYQVERPWLLTDEGQRAFLKVRDRANHLADYAGAFTAEKAMWAMSGDSWKMSACIDRLVELGEFKYVYSNCMSQHRVLIRT